MKSLCLALLVGLTLSAGSGCCLMDCLLGHHCGYGGGCDDCCNEACGYCGPHCGACGCCGGDCSCPPGGCGPGGCANGKGGPATTAERPVMEPHERPVMQPHVEAMPVSHTESGINQAAYEAQGGSVQDGYAQGGYAHDGYGHAEFDPACQSCQQCRGPCGRCGNCTPRPNCADGRRAVADQLGGPAGPPCGQVTYPYYTTRGPRDFLLNNPPRIGP